MIEITIESFNSYNLMQMQVYRALNQVETQSTSWAMAYFITNL